MGNLGDEYMQHELRNARIFDRLSQRIGAIIMSSADQAVSAVADQLGKAKAEIDAVLEDLQQQSVSQATLDRLQALSQSLDDVVPDPEPTPDPEPEPVEDEAPAADDDDDDNGEPVTE